jgi:uncharacterized Tic20 family protein
MVKTNERLLAALSHAGAFFPGLGIVIQALVWSLQHKKSKYVSYQSAQAGAWHIGFIVVNLLVILVVAIISQLVLLFGVTLLKDSPSAELFVIIPIVLVLGLVVLPSVLYTLIALVGVIAGLLGKEFRYPLLGDWLQKYLDREAFLKEGEEVSAMSQMERWMAVCSHLSIFISIWGIALPLILWLTADKYKMEFCEETKQAAVFQGIQAILIGFFQVLSWILGLFFLWMVPSLTQNNFSDSGPLILFIGAFLVLLFIALLFLIFLAIFQTIGIVAAVKTMQGKKYDYPVISRWLDKLTESPNNSVTPG